MILHPYQYDISLDVTRSIKRSGIDLENFLNKTILITGGTGFFGVWLLSALLQIKTTLGDNIKILALSREPEKFLDKHPLIAFKDKIEFIKGDVKDFKLDQSDQVTHLIHMATTNAEETFAGEDQLNKLELLYFGTKNTIEQCGSSLTNALFTSSGVAYGINSNSEIKESDLTSPDPTELGSALGLGKITAEYLFAYYATKFQYKYSIARCFAFGGQYLPLNIHYALGNFILNAIEGKNIVVKSDGKDIRSYLYIGDAISWLLRLIAEPKNQIYNVGSSQSTSIENLAHMIATRSAKPIKVKILGRKSDEGNFRRNDYLPSNVKIKNAYPGLDEWTDLENIIDKMLTTKVKKQR
jgi:dTDP-glucose 4,6-dehydratase/UDP-glucose 4-epimerase